MVWTDERIEALCALWRSGYSAAEIASRFADVSRSAVLGKVHRLRAEGIISAERGKPATGRHHVKRCTLMARQAVMRDAPALDWRQRRRAPVAFLPPLEESVSEPPVPLLALEEHMCRWPIGTPKTPGFGFCGCEKVPSFSYCPRHVRTAYQPAKPRT